VLDITGAVTNPQALVPGSAGETTTLPIRSATSVTLFQSGNGTRSDAFTALGAGAVKASLVSGGERYEKVRLTTPGSVALRSAGIVFTPVRETPSLMRGHFISSDGLLNRIWYAGAYTLNLNQLQPGTATTAGAVDELHLILDGPKRRPGGVERRPGDPRPH
jgi:hypothetical protein